MAELPCHVAELILDFSRNVAESDHRESTVHACSSRGQDGGRPSGSRAAGSRQFISNLNFEIQKQFKPAQMQPAGPTTQLNSCARPIYTC